MIALYKFTFTFKLHYKEPTAVLVPVEFPREWKWQRYSHSRAHLYYPRTA